MLNMATKAFPYTMALLFCCTLEAQTSVPSVVFHGNCGADLPRFEEWFRDTRLAQGQPYVAAQDRSRKTITNYPKLNLEMSMSEVEEYLGKPDFAIGTPAARLATAPEPADHGCSVQTAYIFNKNGENMTDLQDVAIYLFFSRDGKLYWTMPQNLPDLKPLGSPKGASLKVQSQIVWKEYIFADDGFAITLPSDPHPHKSPQVPNGMAYSVPLSSGHASRSTRRKRTTNVLIQCDVNSTTQRAQQNVEALRSSLSERSQALGTQVSSSLRRYRVAKSTMNDGFVPHTGCICL